MATNPMSPDDLEQLTVGPDTPIMEAVEVLNRAHKRIEVVAGFRVTRYNDVGIDLRPNVFVEAIDGNGELVLKIDGFTQTSRSVTYEGFYGGIVVRLY